jgi:hypothetical protein
MECHLSLLNQTKIDRAKNQQSFTSFVYKNANKNTQNQKGSFFRSAAESGCFYRTTDIPFYFIFEQILLGRDGMSLVPSQSNQN